jgi:hypothetical protein
MTTNGSDLLLHAVRISILIFTAYITKISIILSSVISSNTRSQKNMSAGMCNLIK